VGGHRGEEGRVAEDGLPAAGDGAEAEEEEGRHAREHLGNPDSGAGRSGGSWFPAAPAAPPLLCQLCPQQLEGAGRRPSVGRGKEVGGVLDRGGGGPTGEEELDPARWRPDPAVVSHPEISNFRM
jgi:hypothetical protein